MYSDGEIYTTYGAWFDKCVSHTDEETVEIKKYFEYGDILFAITGESVEDEIFEEDSMVLEHLENGAKTYLRKIILIYDYLKWGK